MPINFLSFRITLYTILTVVTVVPRIASGQDTALVGRSPTGEPNFTPVNQLLTPYGQQVDLPGLRPQALTLSPDGRLLAVSGKTNQLLIIDPETGATTQKVSMPAESELSAPSERAAPPIPAIEALADFDKSAQVSYTGLLFSNDGSRIYLSNVNGSIKVFQVDGDGKVQPSHSLPLPNADAPRRAHEIPSGLAVSTLYNTTSVLRTIEQFLGLPPMNQFDASATPMFDCFTDLADNTPFAAVANNVPLDQMNPDPQAHADPQLREDALVSLQLNFREVDRAPEDVLNRILWRSMKGPRISYPEWAAGYDDDDEDEEVKVE